MTDRLACTRRARITIAGLTMAALLCASPLLAQSPAASCESLASRALPNTAITLALTMVPGAFTPPAAGNRQGGGLAPATAPPARGAGAGPGAGRGAAPARGRVTLASAGLGLGYNGGRANAAFSELPAFCRVAVTLTPTPTSDIRAEVWLPLAGWNGNFRGTSPNGTGGNIAYASMANALRDGYAVASSDTGHRAGDTTWMRDAEKLTDFGHRAMHETTVAGKALTSAFYGRRPRFLYMTECGGGSTAAMSAVQQHPADYDGVVVGGFAAVTGPARSSRRRGRGRLRTWTRRASSHPRSSRRFTTRC